MRTNDNNYYTKPKCILMAFVLSSAHLGAVATRSVRGCSETAAGSALATPAADGTAATRHRSLRAAGRASLAAAGTSLTNFAGAILPWEKGEIREGGRERRRFLRSSAPQRRCTTFGFLNPGLHSFYFQNFKIIFMSSRNLQKVDVPNDASYKHVKSYFEIFYISN
jgi:hypothetical protein